MTGKPAKTSIPAVGEGKRGEQGHIGYLLRQAGNAHRQQMERALADIAVTSPQFMVLTMLVAYPGASGADLARLSLLTPQTMSVIVANLERDGAVTRRAHAVHGRIQQIEVTDAGRQLLADCRERVQTVERRLLDGLSPADEAAVRRWLVGIALPETGA
jgi:DNA-binding MarR family transcriptional regulator